MIGRDFLSQLSAAPSPSARWISAPQGAANATGASMWGRGSGPGGYFADWNRMIQPTGSPMAGSSFGAASPSGQGSFGSSVPQQPAGLAAPSLSWGGGTTTSGAAFPVTVKPGAMPSPYRAVGTGRSLLEQLMRGFG